MNSDPNNSQHGDTTAETQADGIPDRIEPGLKQTSLASTISFVFGVGALATLIFVRPSMILAVPAILFGHIAKASLKKSNGELSGWGKARLGKLLGYFCLIVGASLFFFLDDYRLLVRGALESERSAAVAKAGEFSDGPLGDIERKLISGDQRELGNSETAIDVALSFRRELRTALNQVLTRRDDRGLGLDTGDIRCYCHLSDSISFIIAVPDYSHYNGAADNVLKKAAWQSAFITIRDSEMSDPEKPLAIGIMESSACQSVMTGSTQSQTNGVPTAQQITDGNSQLDKFIQ